MVLHYVCTNVSIIAEHILIISISCRIVMANLFTKNCLLSEYILPIVSLLLLTIFHDDQNHEKTVHKCINQNILSHIV